MDKINGINSIVSILRGQVTRNSGKSAKSTSSQKSTSASTQKKSSTRQLDSLIVNRINKLNNEDEQFHAKSVRVIVESILAWEFGEEILNDPELESLVNKITNNIESSEKLTALYKEYCAKNQ